MPLHGTSCSNQSPAGGEMRKSRAMRLPSAAQCGIFFMVLRKGCTSQSNTSSKKRQPSRHVTP